MTSDAAPIMAPLPFEVMFHKCRLAGRALRALAGFTLFTLLGGVWLILPSKVGRHLPAIAFSVLLRGFGVDICGHTTERSNGELFLANHVSWIDIPVLGVAVGAGFVAKQDVRHWPIIGRLAAFYGCLFIDRDRRTTSKYQTEALAALLAERSLVLFPEGTTGNGLELLPFRSSLIGAVAGEQGRCIPISLSYRWADGRPFSAEDWRMFAWVGDEDLLPHATRIALAPPIRADVIIGLPIASSCRKAIARSAQETISETLQAAISRQATALNLAR